MQRLADIDVAKPRNRLLIAERGLERRGSTFERLGERRGVHLVAQGLEPEVFQQRMGLALLWREQHHVAEAARIVVGDAGAACEMKDHVIMGRIAPARDVRLADGLAVIDAKGAAHAEMHEQRRAIVEPGEQILAAPLQRLDTLPFEARRKILRKRKAQIAARQLDFLENAAFENGGKPAAHGLDFGKLRHRRPFSAR